MGPLAFQKHLRLMRSLSQPSLFIDVDSDAIRVTAAKDNVLSASTSILQVTATPVTYQLDNVTSGDGSTYTYPATPGLVVSIPGLQPLTIGCIDSTGLARRFWWRGNVPVENARAAYRASGADLLTLAQTFGLAPQLEETAK
jgi:hypothetical protein